MAATGIISAALTLSMAMGVFGHMDGEMTAHGGETHKDEPPETHPTTDSTTYFSLESHELTIRVHIALMIISWFIILPIGNSYDFPAILQICN